MHPLANALTCLVRAHILLIVIMTMSKKFKILQTKKHTIQ